jgi:hypothetical protein
MREIAGVESAGTTELTMAGQVLGTPYYMSPEQWGEISRDGNPEVDGRTDIYSLGLVAYEMITGKRPYGAATLHELRREHIAVSPPPLCEKVPDVPRAFSDAIARAISKDRDDRQSTAGDLAMQLRAGLGDTSGFAPVSRTVPDLPRPESAGAPTQGAPGLSTKSDVNAATIVTVDAVQTTPPSNAQPRSVFEALGMAPPEPPRVVPVGGDGAGAVDLGSSVTIQQQPREQPRVQVDLPPKKSGGKTLVFAGAGVLVLLLLVVGVGGFFAMSWMKTKPEEPKPPVTTNAPREIGRYWLAVDAKDAPDAVRAGNLVTMKSGQDFKIHFLPREDGYLYIIGPGENNVPAIFLTNKPWSVVSGLSSNAVKNGVNFSFPADTAKRENWITLDGKEGTESYTLVFSPQPLTSPAFFSAEATGRPLDETEQAEWNAFLLKYQTGGPVTELNDKDAAAPFVALKAAKSSDPKDAARPVVFEVKIQHK